MVREVFNFNTEEAAKDALVYEASNEFEEVEKEKTYFDTEKKCVDYEVILKRNSDGKFFKGKYTDWGCGDYDVELSLTEVFPKTITTTVYK